MVIFERFGEYFTQTEEILHEFMFKTSMYDISDIV